MQTLEHHVVQYQIVCPERAFTVIVAVKQCFKMQPLQMNYLFSVMALTLGVTPVNIRETVIVNVLTTIDENFISSTSYILALLLSLSF